MSANGKIEVSSVCNPDSHVYGGVEIWYFEDSPVASWRSVRQRFEYNEPTYPGITAASLANTGEARVTRNSAICRNSHGVGENRGQLRPIFSSYPSWSVFFGSEDDTLFLGEREFSTFQQFNAVAIQDPCYSTLPLPENPPAGYEHYRYPDALSLGRPI